MPVGSGCCEMVAGEQVGGHFLVDTYTQKVYIGELSESETRTRFLGVNNRIVAGVLVHTTRANMERCVSSRFKHLGPECASEVRRCRTTPGCLWVNGAWLQRLQLKYEEALTNFAFKFNLRHYI